MSKSVLTSAFVAATLALGIGCAGAAETGTKTMPDSSVYPPPTPTPTYGTMSHHECYLPSDTSCGNRHRLQN
jgi:hypothetical protein